MKRLLVLLLTVMLIWLMLSCSESKFVEPEEPTFQVSGIIYAYHCGQMTPAIPYHILSDYPASISYTNLENDSIYEAMTNSVSEYSFSLLAGQYAIETYSYHWRPCGHDTVNIHADTMIDQMELIGWTWDDTILISIFYETEDTLSLDSELVLLHKLDTMIGGYLYPKNSRLIQGTPYGGGFRWNQYYMPTEPGYYPWALNDDLNEILDTDTQIFPDSMWVHLIGYICSHTDRDSEENDSSISLK